MGTVVALVTIQISPLGIGDGQTATHGHCDDGTPCQVTWGGKDCLLCPFKALDVGLCQPKGYSVALNSVPTGTELSLMLSV